VRAGVGAVAGDRESDAHGGQRDNFSSNPARGPVRRTAHVIPVP
jgi:hypothetical protein